MGGLALSVVVWSLRHRRGTMEFLENTTRSHKPVYTTNQTLTFPLITALFTDIKSCVSKMSFWENSLNAFQAVHHGI